MMHRFPFELDWKRLTQVSTSLRLLLENLLMQIDLSVVVAGRS